MKCFCLAVLLMHAQSRVFESVKNKVAVLYCRHMEKSFKAAMIITLGVGGAGANENRVKPLPSFSHTCVPLSCLPVISHTRTTLQPGGSFAQKRRLPSQQGQSASLGLLLVRKVRSYLTLGMVSAGSSSTMLPASCRYSWGFTWRFGHE